MHTNNKAFFTIFLIVFIDLVGFGLIIPILPYISQKFGANAFQIGLLTATYSFFQLIATPILGRLSDRYGRKKLLIISQLGSALGYVLFGIAHTMPLLFAARIIDGITGGNISIAQAYVADITAKENRAKTMGMLGAAFGLGFIFGPALGGALAEYGYAVPAFAAAGMGIISSICSALFLKETVQVEKAAQSPRTKFSLDNIKKVVSIPTVGILIGAYLAINTAFSVLQVNFVLWTAETFSYGPKENGYLLMYVGILSVIAQLFILPRAVKIFGEKMLIVYATLMVSVGFFLLPTLAHPYLIYLSLIFTNFGFGLSNPVYQSLVSENIPKEEYGEVLGIMQSAGSLGRILGPIIAGELFYLFGKDIPFFTSSAMAFCIFLFLRYKLKRA